MELTRDILDEFKKITSADIEELFANCIVFFGRDYNRIVSFYSGAQSTIDKGVFDNFDKLERDCEKIFSVFQEMSNRLNNLKWWTILEFVEQIDSRLKTLRKINKWSRSSLKGVGYDPAYQVDYITTEGQTLERVVSDVLKNQNQDEWFNIATSNDLKEDDYTLEGGVQLKLNLPNVNSGIQINSVVDVMTGKAIYGKDIYKKIQFDEEDLKVLGYNETIEQSVNILIKLKRNDNPALPNSGLQREVAIGGTRAQLNFPIIQRQFEDTFATDDTLKKFTITTISIEQDNLTIDFQVMTRLDEVVPGNSILV